MLDIKHTDRPHPSILPRWKDPASARHRHGPLLPMQTPRRSLLARLFGGRG